MADEKKSPKNVRALQQFMLKGKKVKVGQVVAKSDFQNKQDWQNLLNMPKPRIEETDDKVGEAKPDTKGKPDSKGMPGA